ncbi:hypothetical protein AJ79_07576 [Helicocarpus griseus UAMH5409]|uniref:Uncharacterized protein n=1 Tax=Helicocarpus griseus UAMH5409 TaxID=1447875 RepID=A0A2B7X1Q5_9EURO|nr:hypothetical protein AJ79_07576 [Helicocarpus griseus UAMH5409]
MATNLPTFAELEETAKATIASLKSFSEFSSAKIAIIGGTALWKYIPNGRTTSDVDFIITVSGAPQARRKIQIDFTPEWQSAYIPAAVRDVGQIDLAALPYISAIDLLNGLVTLSNQQKEAARAGIKDVNAWTSRDMDWWVKFLQF